MASGICQRGGEDEGVHGFLVDDIVKEVQRASRLVCVDLVVINCSCLQWLMRSHSMHMDSNSVFYSLLT